MSSGIPVERVTDRVDHRGTPGLHPLAGTAREVERLVMDWLAHPGAPPIWVRTSGSTAEPKDVALSGRALEASASATLARLGGDGSWVLALPPHYVAGLLVVVRSALAGTSPVLLEDHESLSAATAALPSGRRYLACVPTQLHRWLTDESDTHALRSYDAVLVGGSAARPALLHEARAVGAAIVTTYGMSETCGGCVYDGLPLDGVAVAVDVEGRIRIHGPVLFDGYAGRPELTREVLSRDGWFTTPDLGRFDDDGRLVVVGRADDVVVSGGVNVPLSAVERVIAEFPGIAGVCVVGRPDAEWGAAVVAVIVPAAGFDRPDLTAIRDAVGSMHPRAWAPRDLVVVDQLPMLETGKVDRRAVVAAVVAG